jgi:hypothetical protein
MSAVSAKSSSTNHPLKTTSKFNQHSTQAMSKFSVDSLLFSHADDAMTPQTPKNNVFMPWLQSTNTDLNGWSVFCFIDTHAVTHLFLAGNYFALVL